MWLQLGAWLLVSVCFFHASADQNCQLSDEPSCSINPDFCTAPLKPERSRVVRSAKQKNCCGLGCGRSCCTSRCSSYRSLGCSRFARSANPLNYQRDPGYSKFVTTELNKEYTRSNREADKQEEALLIQPKYSHSHNNYKDSSKTEIEISQEDKTDSNGKISAGNYPLKSKYYEQYMRLKTPQPSIYHQQKESKLFRQSPQQNLQILPRTLNKVQSISSVQQPGGFQSNNQTLENLPITEENCPYSSGVPEEEEEELAFEEPPNVSFSHTDEETFTDHPMEEEHPVIEQEDHSIMDKMFASPPPHTQTPPELPSRLPNSASPRPRLYTAERPRMEVV